MKTVANLILVGPMGAGKTSIGRRLARRFALQFRDCDSEVEQSTGARVALIFELEGEAGFREREHRVLQRLCGDHGLLIATGGGAVLREENRSLLRRSGFVVYLRCGVERQLSRLRNDTRRPLLAAPDRRDRLQQMAREREPLYQAVADYTFESDQQRVGNAVDLLQREIEQRWQRDTAVEPPA